MLVSHTHKFIYTKTIKTASTSVEAYFEKFCMPNDALADTTDARSEYISNTGIIGHRGTHPREAKKNYIWYNHKSACDIKQDIGDDIWNSYYKFCVVRNPYERAISHFYWVKHINGSPSSENIIDDQIEFTKFITEGNIFDSDKWLYSIDGNFCLNDVVRHENLDSDMKRVCSILGVPWIPEALPNFKSRVTPAAAKVGVMYSAETRCIVEKLCAFELAYFNYEFNK